VPERVASRTSALEQISILGTPKLRAYIHTDERQPLDCAIAPYVCTYACMLCRIVIVGHIGDVPEVEQSRAPHARIGEICC